MREMRSGSQILFGHLPEQTVDAAGGIWKVRRWTDAVTETAIDTTDLRSELIRAAFRWAESGEDGGFVEDMHRQRPVRVKSLNKERGIWCEPFPRLYLCRRCKRLHDVPMGRCECGSNARRGQLPFVGYHAKCGAIKTPYVRKCPQHGQRAVRMPGTASATELIFYCPVCNQIIHRGFGAACDCEDGGVLSFTVHRSGTVFKPHGITLINPAKRDTLRLVENAGGGERAFQWLLEGMPGQRLSDFTARPNQESVRRMLVERGFEQATIDAMVAAMPATPAESEGRVELPLRVRERAEQQARQIALATYDSRTTISDLNKSSSGERLKELYSVTYPSALKRCGIERVELVDRFPVLTAQFGFTRGNASPGASRLRTYRERSGDYVVYGELVETEALFVRLDPLKVFEWVVRSGWPLDAVRDSRSAALAVLRHLTPPDDSNPLVMDDRTSLLTTLIHSYSHAFIRRAAVFAGIERSALSELVLPHAFGFFVYAAARGSFVLGGLQALFESELHRLLDGMIDDEHRCALDPGCAEDGAACAVCLHLGEPSCRLFNTSLSRLALTGPRGYFDLVASS